MASKSVSSSSPKALRWHSQLIGGPFGAGSGHAGDDGADRRSALRTVQTQLGQQRDELHLLHGPQAEMFDAD